MHLGQLLKSVSKDYQKIHVRGVSFDSRKVKKGDIFFAIKGNQTSGINFINEAISKGASAIISDKKAKHIEVCSREKVQQMYLIFLLNYTLMLFPFCNQYHNL